VSDEKFKPATVREAIAYYAGELEADNDEDRRAMAKYPDAVTRLRPEQRIELRTAIIARLERILEEVSA
jgi:hypothetical protein